MTKFSPAAADAFATAYQGAKHAVPVQMIVGGGETNDCPVCGHEHDMGDYPDHLLDMPPDNTFQFQCEECGAEWETKVEWHPVFYTRLDTVKSKTRAEA